MSASTSANPTPHITVCIRVRPPNTAEATTEKVVEVIDEQSLVFDPWHLSKTTYRRGVPLSHRPKNITYGFDHVFGEKATQEEVYRGATGGIVESVLDGYNATVFAYGATGSGKTYTMMGNESAGPGVMGLAMRELWDKINLHRDEFDFEVSVSCLEVYNETLRDLFVQDSPALDMWEDPQGHAAVSKLSVQHPQTVEEVQRLLAEANSRRRQSPTDANAESSRSHAVFQVTVQKKSKAAGVTTAMFVGKLSLIDLAGSERAAKTNNRQERLQEGANINRSLLALANCINALGSTYKTGQHIPFRNSKLTRLLKDSLGGTCRTTMIANVSPSSLSYEDSHNTLKYASRTKNIKINASRKVINVRAHLGQYKEMIESLNGQVSLLRQKLKDLEAERSNCTCLTSSPEATAMIEKFRSLFSERIALYKQLSALEKRIFTLTFNHRTTADEPVLRETLAAKEKVFGTICANEKGLGRIRADVDAMPDPQKQAIMHEVHGLSHDAEVAQQSFIQFRLDMAIGLLRDISTAAILPADNPLSARIRAAIGDPLPPVMLSSPGPKSPVRSPISITRRDGSTPSASSSGSAPRPSSPYQAPTATTGLMLPPPPSVVHCAASAAVGTPNKRLNITRPNRPAPESPAAMPPPQGLPGWKMPASMPAPAPAPLPIAPTVAPVPAPAPTPTLAPVPPNPVFVAPAPSLPPPVVTAPAPAAQVEFKKPAAPKPKSALKSQQPPSTPADGAPGRRVQIMPSPRPTPGAPPIASMRSPRPSGNGMDQQPYTTGIGFSGTTTSISTRVRTGTATLGSTAQSTLASATMAVASSAGKPPLAENFFGNSIKAAMANPTGAPHFMAPKSKENEAGNAPKPLLKPKQAWGHRAPVRT